MDYKLTKYSHGAGCGCKIAPQVLDDILGQNRKNLFPNLLVGNQDRDDAAVFDLEQAKQAKSDKFLQDNKLN